MSFRFVTPATLVAFALTLGATASHAADEVLLTIKNHRFQPEQLEIPANTKVKVRVKNEDPTPEEFESYELNREKIIPGNSSAIVFIGPLKPGSYPFFGEFNPQTAKGSIVVK